MPSTSGMSMASVPRSGNSCSRACRNRVFRLISTTPSLYICCRLGRILAIPKALSPRLKLRRKLLLRRSFSLGESAFGIAKIRPSRQQMYREGVVDISLNTLFLHALLQEFPLLGTDAIDMPDVLGIRHHCGDNHIAALQLFGVKLRVRAPHFRPTIEIAEFYA